MCNTFPCTRFLQYFELQHCTVKLAQNAKSIVCFIFVWIVTLKQMKTFFNNRVHSIILLFVEKAGPYSLKKVPDKFPLILHIVFTFGLPMWTISAMQPQNLSLETFLCKPTMVLSLPVASHLLQAINAYDLSKNSWETN